MATKILLDTDIGSDIDDAVCLAYLLARPDCELLGITTVSGEPVVRAMLASTLCKAAGKDVPIYPGAELPLLIAPHQPKAPQGAMLERWPHETSFAQGEAIEFLRRTIRVNPGEVTLLAIGPMTNVALLFAADPEAARMLKSLVLMCGVFTNRLPNVGPREWNALCDPHAAAIVYRAPVTIHRSVGLDVTCQVVMPADEVRRRFAAPVLAPVLDFADVWFRRSDHITFHDPLAAATLFDDKICDFRRGTVDVELASERLGGVTYWSPADPTPRHEVALAVDAPRFFDHYFATLNQ